MEITKKSSQTITQLMELIQKMEDAQFSEPLPILSGNTIGKHIRHIIELYDQLLKGHSAGIINYDERERNLQLETSVTYATEALMRIRLASEKTTEKPLLVCFDYSIENSSRELISSSYKRELAYNIEHAIHHMAIIKIAVDHYYKEIVLDNHFGVAPSTIKYQKECAQ